MNKKLILQIGSFGVVGVLSALIDLIVTTTLYYFANFPPYLAGLLGFLSAFFFNFPANRKYVFRHTEKDRFSIRAQITLYAGLCLFNILATGVLMQLFVEYASVNISLAKILVIGLIAGWNFLLYKYFIFSKRR